MAKVGDVLFSGSRFIFWGASPFLLLFAIILPLMPGPWSATSIALVSGLDATALLLILALYDPKRFWWAGRSATGIVFVAFVAYLADEISSGKPWRFGPRSEDSPVNALLGLLFIGLPCLRYTLLGRFGSSRGPTWDQLFSEPCPHCGTHLKNHEWTLFACMDASVTNKPQMDEFFNRVKGHEWRSIRSLTDWKADQDNLQAHVGRCSAGGVLLMRWDSYGFCGREDIPLAEMAEIEMLVPATSWRPGPPFVTE